MNYLNCGCGKNFCKDWTNIDGNSSYEGIVIHNLNNGIPYDDNSFEAVYHSHLLEHFEKNGAVLFIRECFRVLKPRGVIRIVVPDLERIAEIYLFSIKQAMIGNEEWIENYEWITMELYDQAVRNYPGGEMSSYLSNKNIKNKKFILERIGQEAKYFFEKSCKNQKTKDRFIFREWLIKKLLGENNYSALKIGRFRQRGGIHQWMYDRYSVANLLKMCDFFEIQQKTADSSLIENWTDFQLDTDKNGIIRKPDSIYMEAIKAE